MAARKPYFRAFDGWWYAQIRVAAKRKQIKLLKGKENEQEAYRAFCRLLADFEGEAPKPQAMTAATVSDLFLDFSEKHHKPETFQLYRYYLQDFCETHAVSTISARFIRRSSWMAGSSFRPMSPRIAPNDMQFCRPPFTRNSTPTGDRLGCGSATRPN